MFCYYFSTHFTITIVFVCQHREWYQDTLFFTPRFSKERSADTFMSTSHAKTLLNPGVYNFTVTHVERQPNHVLLVHTINTGQHAYRHIHTSVPINEWGQSKIERLFSGIDYFPVGEIYDPAYEIQFLGMVHGARVDIHLSGDIQRNVILNFEYPSRPEKNVMKQRDTKHYFKNKNPKKLPIL